MARLKKLSHMRRHIPVAHNDVTEPPPEEGIDLRHQESKQHVEQPGAGGVVRGVVLEEGGALAAPRPEEELLVERGPLLLYSAVLAVELAEGAGKANHECGL